MVALLGPSGTAASRRCCARSPGSCRISTEARFGGRVEVAGRDTRNTRPAELAGDVATSSRIPRTRSSSRASPPRSPSGSRTSARRPPAILPRAGGALDAVGAATPRGPARRRALRRRAPARLPRLGARARAEAATAGRADLAARSRWRGGSDRAREGAGAAVVVSEQRPDRVLDACDRVLFLEDGAGSCWTRLRRKRRWLARERPAWLPRKPSPGAESPRGSRPAGSTPSPSPTARAARARGRRHSTSAGARWSRSTGPNGSGKTTLAKLAAGLLEPRRRHRQLRGRARATSRRTRAGTWSRERCRTRRSRWPSAAISSGPGQRLSELGLAGYEARHPRDLSSGERERLALAAVLVAEPDLLVLDEPTRGVDPERKDELTALLRAQAACARHARRHERPGLRRSGRRPLRLHRGRAGDRPCLGRRRSGRSRPRSPRPRGPCSRRTTRRSRCCSWPGR